MFDDTDRIALIAFTHGLIVQKMPKIQNDASVQIINDKLVTLNQPLMTKKEEEILDQLDRIMDLYRLQTSNRKEFREFGINVMKESRKK